MNAPILSALAQSALTVARDSGLLALVVGIPGFFAMLTLWMVVWAKVSRQEMVLKQQMVERGMTAVEILAVLSGTEPQEESREHAVNLPCASEVVVDIDGEWQTGLILKRDEGRYFVHVVGTEMSENQWVTGDRVRFPAPSDPRCDKAEDRSFPSGFARMASGCGNGAKAKPVCVDQEI
jgi:hypothetical protein